MNPSPFLSPLYDEHISLQAKMGNFAGWQMPIQYRGIIDEHLHTRNAVSLFDVCHMGEFIISGQAAAVDLERLITPSLASLKICQCRYGFLLNEEGKILDDLIAYRLEDAKFMLVVNASMITSDEKWIRRHLSRNTCFHNASAQTAKIDLQGPESRKVLSSLLKTSLDHLRYYHFGHFQFLGEELLVSRTGYTGELGYELYFNVRSVRAIWQKILEDTNVKPAGLGARDTLRTEMGYPLYGQDITQEWTPVESGQMAHVSLDKDFIGKRAIENQISSGAEESLVGFVLDGRQRSPAGCPIFHENEKIGRVTSGSYSPCLKRAIGLGYVKSKFKKAGTRLGIVRADKRLTAKIAGLPFFKNRTRRNER